MRRRQPDTLLNKCLTEVMKLVLKLSTYLEALEDIQNIIGAIPYGLIDEFTSMVIPNLKNPSFELLRSCIHPALRCLDMSSWKTDIQRQMCAVLPLMELRKLSLTWPVSSLWFSSKLVSFTYPDYCTDEIMEELATACKSLQVLDICRSKQMTENSIPFLLQLQELQDLNVTWIGFSNEASARLLFHLPKLKRWQGGYVTKNVYEGCSESLEDYTSVTMNTSVCLANYFPNLTCVSITDTCVPDALRSFGTLEHLQHFNIGFPYEYDLGMREFINIHGKNLLTCSMQEVLLMDFLHFVTMCPQLKTLQLEDCFMSIHSMRDKRNLPHFKSVEKLEVIVSDEDWSDMQFAFPFFDYSNLQHLLAINVTQFNDASIHQAIVERDWLRELRTLELRGNLGFLGIRTYMNLLEQCPYLESMSDLAAWQGLPEHIVLLIRNVCKQKNMDINIIAYPDATL